MGESRLKEENIKKVEADIASWFYLEQLPATLEGFSCRRQRRVQDDVYELFSYEKPDRHRSATAYYHEETKEYKLSVQIGLTQFCRIEFMAPTIEVFEKHLTEHLQKLLVELTAFEPGDVSSIVRKKKIMEWEYGKSLPAELEGFELFISPEKPLKITNGSYIIVDYSDFAIASNFAVYYNIFRDEFFGEGRIRGIPEINYLFDSHDLAELAVKMEHHLAARLQDVRQKAVAQKQ